MRDNDEPGQPRKVEQPTVQYMAPPKQDPMVTQLLTLFGKLSTPDKLECLGFVRGFVEGRRPHSDGQDLQVASS